MSVRRLPVVICCAVLAGAGAAWAGENVGEELAGLRKEVAELRAEVAKLVARQDEQGTMLGQLLEAARRLKDAGKIGDRELAVVTQAIRKGGEAGSRAMGLLERLPAEQRCRVLGALVGDFQVQGATRETLLRRLVAEGGDAARLAVREAIERERLLPAGSQAGYHGATYDFRLSLAVAAGDLKDKVAIDLTLECLEETAKQASAFLADAKKGGWAGRGGGLPLYGHIRTVIWRLRVWSEQAGLEQFANANQGWGGVTLGSEEKVAAFKAEVDKARKWWQEGREKFEFPAQTPEPPAPVMPAAPGQPPVPPRPEPKPVEQF